MANKAYIGLAWEHEYKGDANTKNSGYAIEAPSLEGSSGLAEIGVNIGKGKGISADLGVAGYYWQKTRCEWKYNG